MSDDLYDVFLSYARHDQAIELDVERLAQTIRQEFVRQGGREGRVFIDKSIRYGEEWPDGLKTALASSRVMLACVSPAYFKSPWCQREWEFFARRERAANEKLLFPVRLRPWDRVLDLSEQTQAWIEEVERRQMPEVSALLAEDPTVLRLVVRAMLDAMGAAPEQTARTASGVRVIMRLGSNRVEFENCLVRATRATIVGITHQNLAGILARAVSSRTQRKHELWNELRIVFLDRGLLAHVYDERSVKSTAGVVAEERARLAMGARRDLGRFFENRLGTVRWSIHECPYVLPFVGAFFDLPDGQKVAQVAGLAPGRPGTEALYMEFNSFASPGETAHYESSFERIVAISRICDEMVVVGYPGPPPGNDFIVTGRRARAETWHGNAQEYVAAVIALLWQRGEDGAAQPLLQVRTPENSRRELDHLSNLSGFVNVDDLGRAEQEMRGSPLPEAATQKAVNREIGEELSLGERRWSDPVRVDSVRYHFSGTDRESFMFFLYLVELKPGIDDLPIPAGVRLAPWSLADLVELRRRQVLRLSANAIETEMAPVQLNHVLKLTRLNLLLHDEADLANNLDEARATELRRKALIERLRERLAETEARSNASFVYAMGSKDRPILGFAGLHYREFFHRLVPAYASIGIPGAVELRERTKLHADQLAELYRDRRFIQAVPVGLDDLHEPEPR